MIEHATGLLSSVVERITSNDEVASSILVEGIHDMTYILHILPKTAILMAAQCAACVRKA
jgi:hypothetical protein